MDAKQAILSLPRRAYFQPVPDAMPVEVTMLTQVVWWWWKRGTACPFN